MSLVLLFSSTILSAQEKPQSTSSYAIFGVPQYLFTNGLRMDFDMQMSNPKKWLIISPYYFYANENSADVFQLNADQQYDTYNNSYDTNENLNFMRGFGLGIKQRYFLGSQNNYAGFYLQYGGTYRYHRIEGDYYDYKEYVEDGTTYMRNDLIPYKININSIMAETCLGYQVELVPYLLLDFYLGFGLKYGNATIPDKVKLNYNRGYLDYAYTGTILVTGFRLGMRL